MKPTALLMIGIIACTLTVFGGENSSSTNSWKEASALFQTLEKNFSTIQTVQTKFTEEKKLKIFNRTVRL